MTRRLPYGRLLESRTVVDGWPPSSIMASPPAAFTETRAVIQGSLFPELQLTPEPEAPPPLAPQIAEEPSEPFSGQLLLFTPPPWHTHFRVRTRTARCHFGSVSDSRR